MAVIAQTFGGTSVGSVERIRNVASRVAKWRSVGHRIVVVPSAMSGETNHLLALAANLQERPDPREVDMVAATGERVTVGRQGGIGPGSCGDLPLERDRSD